MNDKRSGSRFAPFLAFALGVALGAIIAWAVVSSSGARVHVVEGQVASVNSTGTAFSLVNSTEGYRIGTYWQMGAGPWNDTLPTCLEPLTSGQKIRFGVINFAPTDNAFGGSVVVWVQCQD